MFPQRCGYCGWPELVRQADDGRKPKPLPTGERSVGIVTAVFRCPRCHNGCVEVRWHDVIRFLDPNGTHGVGEGHGEG